MCLWSQWLGIWKCLETLILSELVVTSRVFRCICLSSCIWLNCFSLMFLCVLMWVPVFFLFVFKVKAGMISVFVLFESMCVCLSVCVHVCVCESMYVCVCVHVCMHACTHVRACVCWNVFHNWWCCFSSFIPKFIHTLYKCKPGSTVAAEQVIHATV